MSLLAAPELKAPFPAFGGKSRIAPVVWQRLGDPRNYIEPFAFSAAMLLKRGSAGAIETINDRNAFVANFWRAVQKDPDAVAAHADWPVNETDLHARHRWLVGSDKSLAALNVVREDVDAFDARIAGWWCWGACCWIGSGWCDETHRNCGSSTRPDLEGQLVTSLPNLSETLPHMDIGGRLILSPQLPMLGGDGSSGRGVHAPHDRQPALAQGGWGINTGGDSRLRSDRRAWITDWMYRLADRLRPVRVCCGHWNRICDSDSTMTRLGTTGVFLDPPYRVSLRCGKKNRTAHIYANDRLQDVNALCDEVREWCLRWGTNKEVRIALCGLEGEYPEIEAAGWDTHAWKSNGGYGNRSMARGKNDNAERERVWFSPHCVKTEGGLWD